MTLKLDVIEINRRHPSWTSDKIAEFLNTSSANVRTVGYRSHLRFAPKTMLSIKRRFVRVPYAGKEASQAEW